MLKDANLIYPGQMLRIPTLSKDCFQLVKLVEAQAAGSASTFFF